MEVATERSLWGPTVNEGSAAHHYFFFLGLFFLTPPAVDADKAGTGTEGAGEAAASAACELVPGAAFAGGCSGGSGVAARFCILRMRERLSASNRLRNIDE